MYDEYEACLLTPITEVLEFLAVIRLDSPHDVDEVAGDVAGDVGVSQFRGRDARKSNTISCAVVPSVDDIVVERRSVVAAAATAAALDGDDLRQLCEKVDLVSRCCSSRYMTMIFVALRRNSQQQQVSAVRIRSSISSGPRRTLHLANLMDRSSARSAKDI